VFSYKTEADRFRQIRFLCPFFTQELCISIINSLGQSLYLETGNGVSIKSFLLKLELYINIRLVLDLDYKVRKLMSISYHSYSRG
jgi:hypothetical protein